LRLDCARVILRSLGVARSVRIVQLITRMIVGGAQRIVLETAHALRLREIEVEIWFGPQEGPEGSLAGEARERGIPSRTVPELIKEVDPLRDLLALRRLTHSLHDAKPDLVHTHSSKAGILGRAAARLCHVPRIIHTIHGWGFSEQTASPARWAFVRAERLAAGWADTLIAVSDRVRETGLRHRIGGDELYRVVPPGIEMEPFSDLGQLKRNGRALRRTLGIGESARVAGTIGRLSPQKNPEMILEAAGRLPELHWILVGDGPLRSRITARLVEMGLQGRVHLVGLTEQPADWYGALDLFVLPSLWEGLPLTLIEAGAAGVPAVAATVGGVAEVLPGPPAGHGFSAGDLEAFVRAVQTVMEAPEAAREAARENRSWVFEHFHRERMLRETFRLYGL
jgi:glycosyltransferase involved in cell wall biosynthesis